MKLSSNIPIENHLKHEVALSPLLIDFVLEYSVRKVQVTDLGVDMDATEHILT